MDYLNERHRRKQSESADTGSPTYQRTVKMDDVNINGTVEMDKKSNSEDFETNRKPQKTKKHKKHKKHKHKKSVIEDLVEEEEKEAANDHE